MRIVQLDGPRARSAGAQDSAIVRRWLPTAERNYLALREWGKADVYEESRGVEGLGVEVGERDGKGGLLGWRYWGVVLDVVERHFDDVS